MNKILSKLDITSFLLTSCLLFVVCCLLMLMNASPVLAQGPTGTPYETKADCLENCTGFPCEKIEDKWYCIPSTDPDDRIDMIDAVKRIEQSVLSEEMNASKWSIGDIQFKEDGATPGMIDNVLVGLTMNAAGLSSGGSDTAYNNGGAIGAIARLTGSMYKNQPSSSIDYFADIGSRMGVVEPAYAQQGTGWRALSPVLEMWKAFRNVAYLGFVLLFIVLSFMIMFRAKLDPQTVVTFQSALPKLIITLLAITFSYAIAGLMIDLMYILIHVFVSVFSLNNIISNPKVALGRIFEKNIFQNVYGGGLFTVPAGEMVDNVIKNSFDKQWIGKVAGWLGGNVLFTAIMAIVLLFTTFKIFISLLICYVSFIVQVVFSPIMLLFNVLPGSKSFGAWIKGMLANILPFVAVAIMFLLAAVFIGAKNPCPGGLTQPDQAKGTGNLWCVNPDLGFRKDAQDPNQPVWVPPFLTLAGETGAGSTHPILGLIGIGIILMTPKVSAMIKKQLQVEPSGIGGAVMAPIVSGFGTAATALQQIHGYRQTEKQKSTAETRHQQLLNRLGSRPPAE